MFVPQFLDTSIGSVNFMNQLQEEEYENEEPLTENVHGEEEYGQQYDKNNMEEENDQQCDKNNMEEEYDPQCNKNNMEEEIVDDVEMNQEQSVEEEGTKFMYHDAEAVIKAEMKEVICKKETGRTNLVVLSEHRSSIMQQMKEYQDLRDKVEQENAALNVNANLEKDELTLQNTMTCNGEILGRLEEFMMNIEIGFKQLKARNDQLVQNLASQKKKILDFQSEHQGKMNHLKNNINDLNSKSRNAGSSIDDPLKKQNMILKAKVVDMQDYLSQLKLECSQMEMKKEKIAQKKKDKGALEQLLKDKKEQLQQSRDLQKEREADLERRLRELELERDEKNRRLNDALKTIGDINEDIKKAADKKEETHGLLLRKEGYSEELTEKITKIRANLQDRQIALEEHQKLCEQNNKSAQNKLRNSEDRLTTIKAENDQLNCCLAMMKQQYILKIEERSDKLMLKSEIGKKISSEEILLAKIKLLQEQIEQKKKTPEELLQKIDQLSSDHSVQDLNKKKAYLISSKDYLSEKLENIRKQFENVEVAVKELQKDIDGNNEAIQAKQGKCDALKEELQGLKDGKAADEIEKYPPASILKSPLTHRKNAPVSPKKVQFEGVSSGSGTSGEALPYSGSTQQSIVGKTFDELWNEIQAESLTEPEKNPKISKKRKLCLE